MFESSGVHIPSFEEFTVVVSTSSGEVFSWCGYADSVTDALARTDNSWNEYAYDEQM